MFSDYAPHMISILYGQWVHKLESDILIPGVQVEGENYDNVEMHMGVISYEMLYQNLW